MSIEREYFKIRDHCHVNSNGEGDCFVGIKADSENVMVSFPMGYELPEQDEELRRDIKNLFRILASFTDKKDRVLEVEKSSLDQEVEFPIQAYLNVINYFLDRNGRYYTETEVTYKTDGRGKADWGRTIKRLVPAVQGNSFIYLKQVVRNNRPDMSRLITRIHRYCVYESFERIGWLFTTGKPEQPDIAFDKYMFVATLNEKLGSTNNDADKSLFRSMIAMIEFKDSRTAEKQLYFGTDKFETVWEKLVDKVFGIPNKKDYFPHALWTARYGKDKDKPATALEPDSIMVYGGKYYVLDAKYYRYGILPSLGIAALPQSSDINKQITYGQFVKNKKVPVGGQVFNAFIMPYNRARNFFGINGVCGNVAEAIGDWVDNPEAPEIYERVQGIVVDTRYLLKNYDGNHDADCAALSAVIEQPFLASEAN